MSKLSRIIGVISLWILGILPVISQNLYLKGIVTDESTDEPVSFVTIIVSDYPNPIENGMDGAFVFNDLTEGIHSIQFIASGYESLIIEEEIISPGLDLGTIKLKPSQSRGLSDLMVMDLELDMESNIQDIAPLLTSSRDVFNNVASYSLSPVRFRQRGYEGKYSDVYLNGLKMNDMSSGNVIWSLWGGVNDATRNQENYFGLETGNFAFGNLGGVTNIITRASKFRPGSRLTYSMSNRTYTNRAMVTHATGIMDNGWSLALSVSRRWGEGGYVNGVFYDAWGYFLALEKKLNEKHSVAFTAVGTPTERGVPNGSTQEVYDLVGSNFYNSNIGYQNGEKWRNARVRDNHEPIMLLNHYWDFNVDTKLTTSIGYRFGYNGYSAMNWYDAPDPRPDYYRNLPSYYDNEGKFDQGNEVREMWYSDPNTRYINWDRLYNVNYENDETITDENGNILAQGKRSKYVIEDRRNDQKQINAAMVFNTKLTEIIKLDAGINYRKNTTANFNKIKDLLGGDYWLDIDQFAERDFAYDKDIIQSDLRNPNRIVREGDTYSHNYDAHIQDYKLWATATANLFKVDAYAGFEIGNSSFYRTGNYQKGLFPDNSYGDSEKKSFTEFAGKIGGTYKISGRHYLTANAGYIENAPNFKDAFISPRTRNTLVDNLKTEKIASADINYLIRSPFAKGRVTAYYTRIMDQTNIMSFYDDYYRSFGNYMMTNIDKDHMGVELGVELKLSPTFTAEGMLGYGEYKYASNPNYVQTVDNTEEILEEAKVYWKDFRVEGTPMSVGSLGISYNSPNYWFIGIKGNYFGNSYISMNPVLRTDRARQQLDPEYIDQERFGSGFTLDAFAGLSYRIQYKYFLGINISANNLLDRKDMKSGGYEQLRVNVDRDTNELRRPFDKRYFYMFGRNFFFNINFRF
ncbi:MAG: TonB-dependent receptor [Dysgonamonadaceae bacterium]|nr:TonB-dependent receptor [Dysgonamonadaceae bacterium]